jgi:low affinity Fe/Cu permease
MDAWDPTNTELNKQLDETIERLTQNRIESGVATIESKKTSKASRMIGAVKNAIGRDVYPINKTLPNKDIKDYVLPGKLEAKYIPAP